jgi:hypothetical protein
VRPAIAAAPLPPGRTKIRPGRSIRNSGIPCDPE